MQTTRANHSLETGEWNNYPGVEPINATLLKLGAEVVDTDEPYWVNKNDTLVFQLELPIAPEKSAELIARFIPEVVLWQPDEVDYRTEKLEGDINVIIFRIWWD